ncbi:alpha/beta fold hydrolase [Kocuria nitroreducens]|uniref:alpha/beta fold hydrolase n=1 Tax=Kocuria nitroreducens TaxID=3058914 RepID=UPI0036DDABAE
MGASRRAGRGHHRILKTTAGAVLVAALALALVLRSPSPVGHWNSAEGRAQFLADYEAAMQDMPAASGTLDVRTDYGIVRVYRFEGTGDADPLVLLPGRSSPAPVWADNLPALLGFGDVYALDLLGEPGMSVQEVPIGSDTDHAAWLGQVLERLPEERFTVVGMSIGGWTAANLAAHVPDRVAAVVLIDPVLTFSGIPAATAIRAVPASVPWLPTSWRDAFNSYTAGGAPVEDVPVARMTETAMRTYSIRLPQPALIDEEALHGLRMPVLVILAGESVMHDVERSSLVAERTLRNGTVRVYPGASHAVGSERAAEIAQDIEAFLDQP